MLVIQTNKGNVYFHQPFKEGHLKVEILGQIVYVGTGAQLLVVPNQNEVLASLAQCGNGVGLKDFSCLFHNDNTRLHLLQNLAVFGSTCGCHSDDLGIFQNVQVFLES